MERSIAVSLPPLRRKIMRSFLVVVLVYGLLGVVTMTAVLLASGITPKIIHVNYDSISAAAEMREALYALRHPEDYPSSPTATQHSVHEFDRAIAFEKSNITEPGEREISETIEREWASARKNPETIRSPAWAETFRRINEQLDRLVAVNEKGMFHLAESAVTIRSRVVLGSILLFLLTFLFAIYLSDGLAERVSRPLKEIAEALRTKPVPGQKLRLPTPTSLEMRILTHEMGQLWRRLSELRQLNIEEIANQRSKLEIVLESVEDAILVLDTYGIVLQCNSGMCHLVGLPQEAITGHPWRDLSTSAPNYLKLRGLLQPKLEKDSLAELSIDNRPRVYSARSRNIENKVGESIGTLYLLHDITELKQRERLKAEFIGVLSHELKTPLQSLGTASELLMKRKESLSEENQMLVETVHEDVERIRAVAQDFVQVTFADNRFLKLKIAPHPLSDLIREWVKPFKLVGRDRKVGVELDIEGPEAAIYAHIDEVKFPWAISNLLSNAIRFSPSDSRVTVKVKKRDGTVEIDISDEGPGIPEDVRRKMFDPYFQATSPESMIPSGFLGLGLTIAKEVVEAHRGRIEYLPGKPKGSTFRITLPAVQIVA